MVQALVGAGVQALDVRHLRMEFPGTVALADFSLSIARGEVHALIGQNGSGKSTFIKVLAGFHRPTAGTVEVLGSEIQLGDSVTAHRAGLRFVHQDLSLVNSESTLDNLALGFGYRRGRLGRIRWAEEERLAAALLRRLGHEFDVTIPVERLSAVERTTVAIARALQDWEEGGALLVLDEPTATMSSAEVDRILDLIGSIRAMGASVLYVSHHLEEVLAVADRITVLRDGQHVGLLEGKRTSQSEIIRLMTGGSVESTSRPTGEVAPSRATLRTSSLSGKVLQSLDLTVRAGEIVGVAGLDGSGRDEVCRLIFGADPRGGELWVDDELVKANEPADSVELGMGYVPGDRHGEGLVMSLDLMENLTLTDLSRYWGKLRLNSSQERSDVEVWISRLGIVARGPSAAVESLSGGNQQKVVMGKWLRLEPRILLLDEPTQGVDVAAKVDVHALIREAGTRGTAVLISSSDEDELVTLCSRVLVLRRGRLVATLTGTQISRAAIAGETLGGSSESAEGTQGNG